MPYDVAYHQIDENIQSLKNNPRKTLNKLWAYHDHDVKHGKHGDHAIILLRIMATMPINMATMQLSWHDHDDVFQHHDVIIA